MSHPSQSPLRHAIDWFEIPCADIDRAQAFYEQLLGQPLQREAYGPPGAQMALLPASGAQAVRGALYAGPQAPKPGSQGVLVYLAAGPRLADTLARAQALGAPVLQPLTALPDGLGCIAQILDCEGNRIGLHAEEAA